MSTQNSSIHDFQVNLICQYYSNLYRQGPGSVQVTKKALDFIDNLTENSRIADIGCGTGGQTVVLAQNAPGHIWGVDLFPLFIDLLNQNALKENLQDRISGLVCSMDNLPFDDQELDLIWSEGAIYNIGFEQGLNKWRRFLKKGGYIAVSEVSWFTDDQPDKIRQFWMDAYPQIDTIPNKMAQMQRAGYTPVASFTLGEECWIENFYDPQVALQEKYLEKYRDDKGVCQFIENQREEALLYKQYKDYYGYVFYIGKKI